MDMTRLDYMGDEQFNQKSFFALTAAAVKKARNGETVEDRNMGKKVCQRPKDYSPFVTTLLATSTSVTPESSPEEFLEAVESVWDLFVIEE